MVVNFFIALYSISLMVAVGILVWFRTAGGKRWLAEL